MFYSLFFHAHIPCKTFLPIIGVYTQQKTIDFIRIHMNHSNTKMHTSSYIYLLVAAFSPRKSPRSCQSLTLSRLVAMWTRI